MHEYEKIEFDSRFTNFEESLHFLLSHLNPDQYSESAFDLDTMYEISRLTNYDR